MLAPNRPRRMGTMMPAPTSAEGLTHNSLAADNS
jgi:hypothetical protein